MLTDFQNHINSMAMYLGLEKDDSDFTQKTWSFEGREVTLSYGAESDEIVIQCLIAQLPEDKVAQAYREVFKGNYAFAKSGGAILTIEDDNGLYMQVRYPLRRLDYVAMEQLLTNFLDVADYWYDQIQEMNNKQSGTFDLDGLPNFQLRV